MTTSDLRLYLDGMPSKSSVHFRLADGTMIDVTEHNIWISPECLWDKRKEKAAQAKALRTRRRNARRKK